MARSAAVVAAGVFLLLQARVLGVAFKVALGAYPAELRARMVASILASIEEAAGVAGG